jgi:ubiquinone biosynthesis protein UbiJ
MNILPIKTLEKTFNRYLALDSESKKLLMPLVGKVLGLHIQRPKISIYFTFHADGAHLSMETPTAINTDIHATLFQLMRLKFNKNAAITNTQFYIKGDVDTAQLFNQLLQHHQIDWEEHLSKIIGDVTANKMMQLLKKPTAFLKRNKEKFTQDVTEYCQEETQILPSQHEVAAFQQEVDGLRLEIDRLEAKIDLLKK